MPIFNFSDISKNIKTKIISWIANELSKNMSPSRSINAMIEDTATLAPESLIENFFGERNRIHIGKHSFIRGHLLTWGHGGRITIGDWCYVGHRSEIWSMESIAIGNRVLIAHDVNINDGTSHSLNPHERHTHFRHIIDKGHPREKLPGISSSPIIIEDDVWISFGVTILQGVRIGAGSVIAAGSIVTKNVPPGVLFQCKVHPIIRPLNIN